jgi:hypothetical protein
MQKQKQTKNSFFPMSSMIVRCRTHEFVCFFLLHVPSIILCRDKQSEYIFQENNLLLCNKTNDKYIKIRLMRTKISNLVCTTCFWNNIYPVRSGERLDEAIYSYNLYCITLAINKLSDRNFYTVGFVLDFLEHPSSPPVFSAFRVALSLVFVVPFLLAIVLSVLLRLTASH